MPLASQKINPVEQQCQTSAFIETTLYELVEAIVDEINPGEEGLITEVIISLAASGKIRMKSESFSRRYRRASEHSWESGKNQFSGGPGGCFHPTAPKQQPLVERRQRSACSGNG